MPDTYEAKRLLVTPETASQWLKLNEANRPLRSGAVQKMADDIADGLWLETNPQPLIFDTSGALIDGQHRLSALVRANRPLWFLVVTNVPRHTQLVIDDHLIRSVADFARWEMPGHKVSRIHVATARAMISGLSQQTSKRSRTVIYKFLRDHFGAIEFATGIFARQIPYVSGAITFAIFARASYTADHDRLRRFAQVLDDGMPHGESESAAVVIHRFIAERQGQKNRAELYAKFERALAAFLRGELFKKAIATKEELFPLPEERAAETPAEPDTPDATMATTGLALNA